jgi:hypothetical protein
VKPVKPFKDVHIEEDDIHGSVERLSDSIRRALSGITQSDIISGSLLTDISLSTAARRIEHKLGRKPLGYIVVKRDANAVIYDEDEQRQDLFLNLIASADVTISLWVF